MQQLSHTGRTCVRTHCQRALPSSPYRPSGALTSFAHSALTTLLYASRDFEADFVTSRISQGSAGTNIMQFGYQIPSLLQTCIRAIARNLLTRHEPDRKSARCESAFADAVFVS